MSEMNSFLSAAKDGNLNGIVNMIESKEDINQKDSICFFLKPGILL